MLLEVGVLIISAIYWELTIGQALFYWIYIESPHQPIFWANKQAYLNELTCSRSHSWEVTEPVLEPGKHVSRADVGKLLALVVKFSLSPVFVKTTC